MSGTWKDICSLNNESGQSFAPFIIPPTKSVSEDEPEHEFTTKVGNRIMCSTALPEDLAESQPIVVEDSLLDLDKSREGLNALFTKVNTISTVPIPEESPTSGFAIKLERTMTVDELAELNALESDDDKKKAICTFMYSTIAEHLPDLSVVGRITGMFF
eukprot:Rmarinus@m.11290